MASRLTDALRRRVASEVPHATPPPADPRAREALEERLLERFDAVAVPGRPHHRGEVAMRTVRRSILVATILAALLFVARSAPAEVTAILGKRLAVDLPPDDDEAQLVPRLVVDAVRAVAGQPVEVRARVEAWARRDDRSQEGRGEPEAVERRLELTIYSPRVGAVSLTEVVRRAVPALAGARIVEESLTVRAEVTWLDKLAHDLLRRPLGPEALEQARRKLEEEVRAREGGDARVDVQIEQRPDGGDERRLRIEVRKEVDAPAP